MKKRTDPTNKILLEAEPLIRNLVRLMLRSWPSYLIDEIEQACFVRVWKVANRFDPSISTFNAWLTAVVRNVVRHELRRIKSEKPSFQLLDCEELEDDADETQDKQERIRIVQDAIATMKPSDQAFLNALMSGRSVANPNIPKQANYTKKFRVIRRLKEKLNISDDFEHIGK